MIALSLLSAERMNKCRRHLPFPFSLVTESRYVLDIMNENLLLLITFCRYCLVHCLIIAFFED